MSAAPLRRVSVDLGSQAAWLGWFHGYGQFDGEIDRQHNRGMITRAIVERENGELDVVPVDCVRFVDRPGS